MSSTKIEKLLLKSKKAFTQLSMLSGKKKNEALRTLAKLVEENKEFLLKENAKDLKREKGKLSNSNFQRLKLDEAKLVQVIKGIRGLLPLADPVHSVLSETLLDDGLVLQKIRVPLGVVGVVFESRPDVIPQVLSLMLKSGNAVVLKGGSEALSSNKAFMKLIALLEKACPFLPKDWAQLIVSRKAVHEILKFPQFVDLLIPRGSNALVRSIMKNTKIPVMGHSEGICHLYVDKDADLEMALTLTLDSKVQYPSACNAIETLLVHKKVSKVFLPRLVASSRKVNLELRGCEKTRKIIQVKTATQKDWSTEYGDLILSIKVVEDLSEALGHIQKYGSAHTETIVSQNLEAIEEFFNRVDSAGVFANASTRFADGFRYGFGAEVGVSTGKLHARGPVGLEGLTTYKYRLRGSGHKVADYIGTKPLKTFKHKKLI